MEVQRLLWGTAETTNTPAYPKNVQLVQGCVERRGLGQPPKGNLDICQLPFHSLFFSKLKVLRVNSAAITGLATRVRRSQDHHLSKAKSSLFYRCPVSSVKPYYFFLFVFFRERTATSSSIQTSVAVTLIAPFIAHPCTFVPVQLLLSGFFFLTKLLVQTLARHKLAICIASLLFARATNLMLAKKGAINRRRSCLRGSNRCLNGTTGMTALQLWDARHTTITPRSHKYGLTKCRIREDAGGRWCVLGVFHPHRPLPPSPLLFGSPVSWWYLFQLIKLDTDDGTHTTGTRPDLEMWLEPTKIRLRKRLPSNRR